MNSIRSFANGVIAHRMPAPSAPIEVAAPPGISPNALDAILESLDAINRRQVRMETRLVRLLKDHGLDTNGRPMETM